MKLNSFRRHWNNSERCLNKQLTQAKTLLRRLSRTVADIEDARTIERAKRAHGSKPRIPWAQVKHELQLD